MQRSYLHRRQFQYIYDHTTEEYPAVGVLTAHDRDTWAKVCGLHQPFYY